MIFIANIIVFLIFQNFAVAEDDSIQRTEISWHYSYTIVLIVASICITIIFTGFACLTLKYMKKKLSQPQYYVDDVSIQKDGNEYNDVISQLPHLNQIQPILTVSQVVTSIKQSLEDLGNTVMPKRWSTMVIEEIPAQEKSDLPI